MTERMIYRQQLRQAVESFLEKTPAATTRAHRIVQDCSTTLLKEVGNATLDDLVWSFLVRALTDSEFYGNEKFLRETREMLLGHISQNFSRTFFLIDYRSYFTEDEAEWYTQLVSLFDFVTAIPFASLQDATQQARQQKVSWEEMRNMIPEVAQIEAIEEEYEQKKMRIESIAAKSPHPENPGDEKIYLLILSEITANLIGIRLGKAAISAGYPIPSGSLSQYGDDVSSRPFNMMESIQWAKRSLEALAGERTLFLSWRLSKIPSSLTETLIISMH